MNQFSFFALLSFAVWATPLGASLPEGAEPHVSSNRVPVAHPGNSFAVDTTPLLTTAPPKSIYTDVPGYEDDAYRCALCCCKVSGWASHLLVGAFGIASSALTSYVALGVASEEANHNLVLVSSILGWGGTALTAYYAFSQRAVEETKKALRAELAERGVIVPETPSTAP